VPTHNAGFLFTFFNTKVLLAALPDIAWGFVVTVALAALVVVAGLAIGLVLGVVRTAGWRLVNWPMIVLVDLLRSVPPLVLIVLLFFGLPSAGIDLSGFLATWVALTAILAAFTEEIIWAAIQAIPAGNREAARSLGLTVWQSMRLVVLPQAIRIAVPALTNRTIAIIKGTAFGSVVGVSEILGASQSAMSFSGNPSPLILGAVAYLILFAPIVMAARRIESMFRWRI
jgi:polar amino acid transport system permease protein